MSSKRESAQGVRKLLDELATARDRLDLAIRDGALQRLLVTESCRVLTETMRQIEQGRRRTTPQSEGSPPEPSQTSLPGLKLLTKREIEVLRLIAEGLSTKEIAHRMNITFKTAVTHRTNILKKLGIHESATLVRLAIRAGLVSL